MSVRIEVPAGTHRVEGRVIAYGGERRVAALRCFVGSGPMERGVEVGECGVDTGRVGFCDHAVAGEAMDRLGDDYNDLLDGAGDRCATLLLDESKEAMIAFADCGFGDGSYPVYELRSGNTRVGAEVEFITPETTYPFNTQAARSPSVADGDEASDALGDMLKELAQTIQAGKTGDPVKDKALMKEVAANILKKQQAALLTEIAPLQQHFIAQRRAAPSIRTMLVPDDGDWFFSLRESRERAKAIEAAGYIFNGTFAYANLPGFFSAIYLHPDGTTAQVHNGSKGVIVELASRRSEEEIYAVFDSPANPGCPDAPWLTIERHPGKPCSELIEMFRARRPPADPLITTENVSSFSAETFARTQDWRIARGGWNREEVRQQLGVEDSASAKEQIEDALLNVREKWLFAWFKREFGDLAEKLLESLMIIHDEHESFMLLSIWMNAGGNAMHGRCFQGSNAREAFGKINAAEGEPFTRVARKTDEFPADFYVPEDVASRLSLPRVP